MPYNESQIKKLLDMHSNGQISDELFKANLEKLTPTNQISDTLKNVIPQIRNKGGLAQNSADIIKKTPDDLIGINPETKYKTRFKQVSDAMGGEAKDAVKLAEEAPSKEALLKLVKGSGGFAKVAPMIGMGVGALGVIPIAKKLQEQKFGEAAMDTAELGANIAFPIASMALNSSPLGAADIPEDEMRDRAIYNANRLKGVSQPSQEEPLLQPEEDPNRAKLSDMEETIQKFKGIKSRVK